MTLELEGRLRSAIADRDLVVMAGAGVSAGIPASLPGWYALNAAIIAALAARVEEGVNRPGWLSKVVPTIDQARELSRFPPEYQAQLIEEMAGDRYFRGLQALDVDQEAITPSHDSIAALAQAGLLRAVVTTNFDRLIEQALDRRGVSYSTHIDPAGFRALAERLPLAPSSPVPIIKVHGCVSSHTSMVDTLRQRVQGRSRALLACLDAFRASHWLYLGFSAADLEFDPDYLGLAPSAPMSRGATFVRFPPSPDLGPGAGILKRAYGGRFDEPIAFVPDLVLQMCAAASTRVPSARFSSEPSGKAQFTRNLATWANSLSVASAALCLAAVLEAIGQAEPAARMLDRLVRKELDDQRDTPDYHSLQLHYGRLGAAWGRFFGVPDLNGVQSNASVESLQSLLRIASDPKEGPSARAWIPLVWFWLGKGEQAISSIYPVFRDFLPAEGADSALPDAPPPADSLLPGAQEAPSPGEVRADCATVDAWLAAAQIAFLDTGSRHLEFMMATAPPARNRARRAADVVRLARVSALELLAHAETSEYLPSLAKEREQDFAPARRVGDGFTLGMIDLALGRWHAGAGGRTLAADGDLSAVARIAIEHLTAAARAFHAQEMDPWILYTQLQLANALFDAREFEQAINCLNNAARSLERFPVLSSHVMEVNAQFKLAIGDADAADALHSAIVAARDMGLEQRMHRLVELAPHFQGPAP